MPTTDLQIWEIVANDVRVSKVNNSSEQTINSSLIIIFEIIECTTGLFSSNISANVCMEMEPYTFE